MSEVGVVLLVDFESLKVQVVGNYVKLFKWLKQVVVYVFENLDEIVFGMVVSIVQVVFVQLFMFVWLVYQFGYEGFLYFQMIFKEWLWLCMLFYEERLMQIEKFGDVVLEVVFLYGFFGVVCFFIVKMEEVICEEDFKCVIEVLGVVDMIYLIVKWCFYLLIVYLFYVFFKFGICYQMVVLINGVDMEIV